MQPTPPNLSDKGFESSIRYDVNSEWRLKSLTPSQLLVNDIRLEAWRKNRGPLLEVVERVTSSLVPASAAKTLSDGHLRATEAARTPIERQNFLNLESDFGWIRHLRLSKLQASQHDSPDSAKCRWIHCGFKDQNYLRGFLWALSENTTTISDELARLDTAIQSNSRYSKHGKYFTPFSQTLQSPSSSGEKSLYPMLIVIPFLDWGLLGSTPALRFQVDRREGFRNVRSSVHSLRSILQYFYRLEDTHDREGSQVFAKHKPWGE